MINTIYDIFQKMFQKWSDMNDIKNQRINHIQYQKRNVLYANYEAWKTTTRDEEYHERVISQDIDIEDVEEYMEPIWMQEIGLEGIIELNMNEQDIYKESESLFNQNYNQWLLHKEEECYEFEG